MSDQWQPVELIDIQTFGVLSHYTSGEYELFVEGEDGHQYRFQFSFNELAQLSKLSSALLTPDYL